ncbi:MAG TPA: carbon starvation protein A, partial [Verrucomicrobiae bacterium]|nr:carbon starvation protein A [Verrucomicrobiae bacterium]
LKEALAMAKAGGDTALITAAEKALLTNRVLHFNNLLDAFVAGFFLVLVIAIVALSVREWILLLARRRPARLRETEAVWLPDYALPETRPAQVLGVIALGCALAKELSGEANLEREQQAAVNCPCEQARSGGVDLLRERKVDCRRNLDHIYVEALERKHNRVNRCC